MKAEEIAQRLLSTLSEEDADLDRYFEVLCLERRAILDEDTEKLTWYVERERELQRRLERFTAVEEADLRCLGAVVPPIVRERRVMIRERYELLSEYCDENIETMNERLALVRDRITSMRARAKRPLPVFTMQVEAGVIDDRA